MCLHFKLLVCLHISDYLCNYANFACFSKEEVKIEEEPQWEMSQRTVQYRPYDDDEGEMCQQVKLKEDEFSGLIGNLASKFMKDGGGGGGYGDGGGGYGGGGGGGGGGGDLGGMLGGLAGQFLKGGSKGGGGGGGGKK